ncbi:triokinase/FMN cyclase-like [Prorops nasuta]|uniref:triokinase/FMN cyclase-like n=1 Tax=Prorops nasuta TaxID=863751 RepID=UPI0034CDBCAF
MANKSGRKHLVNNVDDAVPETLHGLCLTYPHLEYHKSHKVVFSPDWRERKDKVAVICGGGSGHEPFTAGYVGAGMLTASISGSIFAAPPSTHITHAIESVSMDNPPGVFIIVPNYTGDRLNFGIAIEKARQAGIKVREIFVGEDCSISKEEQRGVGKRGLSGMIFVMKTAGALAESGRPLEDVDCIANVTLNNMATYGIGLSACSIPGQGLMFEMEPDEIECGMGIHGEAGCEKVKIGSATEVVALMLKNLCNSLFLVPETEVAVLINNFGSLSQLEQGIVVYETVTQLRALGVKPLRVYSGLLVTSLNSSGVHITILKLVEPHRNLLIRCLDAETRAPKWPGCFYSVPLENPPTPFEEQKKLQLPRNRGPTLNEEQSKLFKICLEAAARAIVVQEQTLNKLDQGCGDGDCGSTLKRLSEGILSNLDSLPLSHPSSLLSELANIAEETMGGTSGALYCLFFTNAAKELVSYKHKNWQITWAYLFRSSVNALIKYGRCNVGDRSMLDTLEPACKMYEKIKSSSNKKNFELVAAAAWEGCNSTKDMVPRVGRASYVKNTKYLQEVDAGAFASATWISAILQAVILNNK